MATNTQTNTQTHHKLQSQTQGRNKEKNGDDRLGNHTNQQKSLLAVEAGKSIFIVLFVCLFVCSTCCVVFYVRVSKFPEKMICVFFCLLFVGTRRKRKEEKN
eukprot:c10165_g2_i1.p1 GENE.c10165_g2_i1~~c10165_g2_i1.p1  ORF type:complete len:102 (-),score=36.02 c10165_g2_i1:215-520(-)